MHRNSRPLVVLACGCLCLLVPGGATAVPSEARMELILNYYFIENYSREDHSGGNFDEARERTSFSGSFRAADRMKVRTLGSGYHSDWPSDA